MPTSRRYRRRRPGSQQVRAIVRLKIRLTVDTSNSPPFSLLGRGPRARSFRNFDGACHLSRGLDRAGVVDSDRFPASILAIDDELHLIPFHRTGDFALGKPAGCVAAKLLAFLFEDKRIFDVLRATL